MPTGSIMILTRVTYNAPTEHKPIEEVTRNRFVNAAIHVAAQLGEPQPSSTSSQEAFLLTLGDKQTKRFPYDSAISEAQALQEAIQDASNRGYSATAAAIGQFANERISTLILQTTA